VSGSGSRKEVGRGRVVYFPSVQFDGPLPEPEPYFKISDRYWKLPKNYRELTEGVRWAAKEDIPVTIDGPLYLVANLAEQRDKRRIMVHLVNYNSKNVAAVVSVRVLCRLPQGAVAKDVKTYSPDVEPGQVLDMTPGPWEVSFTVPAVRTYTIAVVSY